MKPFIEFIPEKIAHRVSVSTMIFNVGVGEEYAPIPLSTPIMTRIFGEMPRVTSYHTTDDRGVKDLFKIQGLRKSISTFYIMDEHAMRSGIQTAGGIIVELEGSLLAAFNQDAMTVPDKTGRRWIGVWQLNLFDNAGKFYSEIKKDVLRLWASIVYLSSEKWMNKVQNNSAWLGWINSMPGGPSSRKWDHRAWMRLKILIDSPEYKKVRGKFLRNVIQLYLDGMEAIVKKHMKELKIGFRGRAAAEETGLQFDYDEVAINEIRVTRVHIPEEKRHYRDRFDVVDGKLIPKDPPILNKQTDRMVTYLGKKGVPVMWHKDYASISKWIKAHHGEI
jgi:hypothetical protein